MCKRQNWVSRYLAQIFLLGMIVVISLLLATQSEYMFTESNIRNILEANTYRLLLTLGMTLVISSGVMDLSAGSIVSLTGILMGIFLHAGIPVVIVILLGMIIAALLGAINGLVIHFTKINFFILTLATATIYRGISITITDGKPVTRFPTEFLWLGTGKILGIQISIWLCLILVLFFIPFMFHTKWGTYIQGLGGNADALEKAGIVTGYYRVFVHLLLGVMAALTAIIITARLNSAEPNAGLNMELDAITAAVMGGTPITGGKTSIVGTVLAVLLLGLIRNGLTILSVSSNFQQLITGGILIISVVFSEIRAHKKEH